MVLAMHFLQPSQRQVGVDLRGGDVGVAQQQLHAAQVGAVLHHVRGATVAQPVRAGGGVGHLHHMPDPLPRQRHSAQREKQTAWRPAARRWILLRFEPAELMRARCGRPCCRYSSSASTRGASQRHNPLLVALAAHLHAAQVERQVAGRERRDLGDAQAARVEQFQNRPVAQHGGSRLRMLGVQARPVQHLRHLRLGQRLGQHLPGFGRFDVDGGIVMDAPVEQEPLVKAAQAAQLARRRTLVDAVAAQMLKKCRHILLRRRQQHAAAPLDELGKGLQVAVVGLAAQRPQPFFHAQIRLVVLQQREIARGFHTFDYRRLKRPLPPPRALLNLASSWTQHRQQRIPANQGSSAFVCGHPDGTPPARQRITLEWGSWRQ